MSVILIGLSHKTAGVELREKLAFSDAALPEALYQLHALPEVDEVLILSTCNRVEIVAAAQHSEACAAAITGYLLDRFRLTRDELLPHLYQYHAEDAIRHIFKVAASLDSLVIGEAQILGQVKDAFEAALALKSTATILNKVYKKAISVAKRIRTETGISKLRVSVSSVAVELAEKIFSSLKDKTVFIIGAGEMAELALKHLVENGAARVMITNRSFEKARALATEYSGTAVPYESFLSEIAQADIIICSTGAPHYLITPENMAAIEHARRNQPIFMIDIAVPRNIDPAVNNIDNVFAYDVDDLKSIVQGNISERETQAVEAEKIVDDEIITIETWLKSLAAVPTIVGLKEKGERIRRAELEKMLQKTNSFSDEQTAALESMTASIVNKLLHAPIIMLRQESHTPEGGQQYVETARKLFNLDNDLKKGHNRRSG